MPPIANARQRTARKAVCPYASWAMNIILTGALVGTGIAFSLVALEYALLRRSSAERARKTHGKDVFDGSERSRMGSLARFCFWIPPAFAILFWVLWD